MMICVAINGIGRNEVAIANKLLGRIEKGHCIEVLMMDIANRINRIEEYLCENRRK